MGSLEENIKNIRDVDVVIMNDVIEHFIQPMDVLSSIGNILKKDGLVLISTPNAKNAGNSLETALEWIGFSVDLEHLQYFTPASIIKVANKYGLELIHLESIGQPCLDKLKTKKSSRHKKWFSWIRLKVSEISEITTFGRATRSFLKEFLKKQNNQTGNYQLFTILQKGTVRAKRSAFMVPNSEQIFI